MTKNHESAAQPAQVPVAFEQWLATRQGDPAEMFLQLLRITYIAGQDSITTPAAPPAQDHKYSIDDDPLGVRARVVDAVLGALTMGAQGTSKPPQGHWLNVFWDLARSAQESVTDKQIDMGLAS
jgi:hypothetical protein